MTLVIKNKEDQEDSDTVANAPEDTIASSILAEANANICCIIKANKILYYFKCFPYRLFCS